MELRKIRATLMTSCTDIIIFTNKTRGNGFNAPTRILHITKPSSYLHGVPKFLLRALLLGLLFDLLVLAPRLEVSACSPFTLVVAVLWISFDRKLSRAPLRIVSNIKRGRDNIGES